jgi:anti-sigma factor RsiW
MHIHRDWLRLIEKRLSPAERSQAEAHLAACPECRAELAEMRELTSAMQAMPSALRVMPGRTRNLWSAIWAQVQRGPVAARPAYLWQLAASMSLVAVCLITLSLFGPSFSGAWQGTIELANTSQLTLQTPLAPHAASNAVSTARAPQDMYPLLAPVQTPRPGPTS